MTLEILLFTTTPCNALLDFSRSLPTMMGPPGNWLDVNMAANEVLGLSATITVTFMGNVFCTSNG
jgi:hypothetical protein